MKKTLSPQRNFTCFLLMSLMLILAYSCKNKAQAPEITTQTDSFGIVKTEDTGMDLAKLAEIPGAMKQFVDNKEMSGAVTVVTHNGQVVSYEAVGYQNIAKNLPMQKNSIFRIASMTKPFVGASIMMLVEEGKLQLDDPVEKYLPYYNNMWLSDEKSADKQVLVRPSRKITIRDILTHTHGLAGIPGNAPIKSNKEYTLVISQLPMLFDVGTKWEYGGSGITTAARIVEVLSGKKYEDFLAERIFEPLGMKNTSFYLAPEDKDRLASMYQPNDSTGIEETPGPDWSAFPRPDGGLYSTALDIAKWMQALLNKGKLGDSRILSEESVNEMTRMQIGDLNAGFTEGMSFGLAVGIVREPAGVTSMLSPGTFGHGGAFGTQNWADPKTNTAYILMIQRLNFGNGDASDIRKKFQEIAASAIVD